MKRWNTLPEAGGLRDQPAGLLRKMGHLLDIYNAHRAYRTALLSTPTDRLGGWESQNPDVMHLLAYVRKLKRDHGK